VKIGMALWSLALYALLAVLLAAAMVGLSYFLGERHHERATGAQYESGLVGTGPARIRFPAHFYLVAIFFVIFDLEAVFFLAWGVAARELGWAGYAGIVAFTAILVAGLIYEWRAGALDWAAHPSRGARPEPAAAPGRA
jgi:NADH-quinone oxidoreductase subunit A